MRVVVPYSLEVLNSIIHEYQKSFFPMQFLFVALALFAIYLLWSQKDKSDQIITAVLALFWFWSGFFYLGGHYQQINWFGFYASIIFSLQGLILLWYGVVKRRLVFQKSLFSTLLALAVLVLLPFLQIIFGKSIYEAYIVGLLPLATLVFTVAIYLSLDEKKVLHVSLIPFLWALFAFYWNYLLANTLGFVLYGVSALGIIWLLYINFRKNSNKIL